MTRGQWLTAVLCCAFAAAGCAPTRQAVVEPAPLSRRPPLLSQTTPSPRVEYVLYEVRRGDTLYSLGRRFGVPWQEIRTTNNIRDVGDLKVGTVLLIRHVEGAATDEPAAPERAGSAGLSARRLAVPRARLHRGRPSSALWWPTSGRLMRGYGQSLRGLSEPGIAIAAPAGTEVSAVSAGEVVARLNADDSPGASWGNVVALKHSGGLVSWYAHLGGLLVRKDQRVRKGEAIGTVGSSGAAAAPQLAFRLFKDERPVDPSEHLP